MMERCCVRDWSALEAQLERCLKTLETRLERDQNTSGAFEVSLLRLEHICTSKVEYVFEGYSVESG